MKPQVIPQTSALAAQRITCDGRDEGIWVTVDEIVDLGRARRKVLVNISSGKWQSRLSEQRAPNRKRIREVALSSLPADLQRLWAERQAAEAADLNDAEDSEPVVLDTDDQVEQLAKALAGYEAIERDGWIAEALRWNQLLDRYAAIKPKREKGPDGGMRFVPAVSKLCAQLACANELVIAREPSRASVPSPHTVDRWLKERSERGLLAFLRVKPAVKSRNDGRLIKATPAAMEWIEKRWRRFPVVTQLYTRWKEEADKQGWTIPSQRWVHRRWKEISPIVKTVLFKGEKVYTDRHKPYLPRTAEGLEALQLLCGDHHVLDVHCWSDKMKALVRLWLTAWQCVRTSLIWGTHLDYTPSSTTIGCAYANGVRTFGAQPPARSDGFQSQIYTDNGKDYKSQNINGQIEVHKQAAAISGGLELLLTQRGVGLANDLEIQQFLARKYNGREKPIERTFRDLADFIQNEFFDNGWCGRNTKDKPESHRELYARHLKAMKRGAPSPFPHESEVRSAVAQCVRRFNTSAHTRAMLGGATIVPLVEHERLYTTRYEIRETTLALMVMKWTRGPLRKNGVVALGSPYWNNELSKYKDKRDADGRPLQFEVRYTDDDYSVAWIVLPDGAICEAERVDLSDVLTPSKASLKAYAGRVRSERELIKTATLLQHSIWRGETVEDRIVASIEPEEVEERIALVAGGGGAGYSDSASLQTPARVHQFTRLDRQRHGGARSVRSVTVDQVTQTEADESIFTERETGKVIEFDFEE